MKRKFMMLTVLAMAFVAFAPSASAIHLLNPCLEADCSGFKVKADVQTFKNIYLCYKVTLTPECGEPECFEGCLPVTVAVLWEPETVPVCKAVCWPTVLCGKYSVTAHLELRETECGPPIVWDCVEQSKDLGPVCVDCPCGCCPGTATPGYWKNHPEAWPVDEIEIGGVTYAKAQAIAILKVKGERGDKTHTMFRALVSAKLNVLMGCDDRCIKETIAAADAWMEEYGPVGSCVKAGGNNSPWRCGEQYYTLMDKYNNGLLCVPSRDEMENNYEPVAKPVAEKPEAEIALGNYPNPFNPNTTITFTLPEPEQVVLKIYNSIGAEVATLTERAYSSGTHSVDWNARGMASGIYFCRIQAGPKVAIRKLMLLK